MSNWKDVVKIDLDLIPGYVPDEVLEDFRNHLYHSFKYLGLGEPSALQYAIAEELQHGPKDFLLQAGRGMGKSVILAVFASWLQLLDPNTTILVCSATSNKAIEFISMTRKILTLVPYMKHLEPDEHTKDSAFGYNVNTRSIISQDLSVFARGITSQLTGSHAFWIFGDDLEAEGKFEGAQAKEKLLRKISEFEQIKNPGYGGIRLLGTPQDEDSIYNKLPYPVIKFPTIMPDPYDSVQTTNVAKYILSLSTLPGDSTDPERFSNELLQEREAKIGPKLFSLHYKLDTSLADLETFPLKLKNLIVMDTDPEHFPEKVVWASSIVKKRFQSWGLTGDMVYEPMWFSDKFVPYQDTVLFVDPSGQGKDETGVAVISLINGYLVVHELLGLQGGYDAEVCNRIVRLVIQYGIKRIICEKNFGSGMFSTILRPIVARSCGQVAIEDVSVSGHKETRIIETLEPLFNNHRVVMDTEALRDKETQYQITRIKRTKGALPKDDRIDVLAFGASFFKSRLSVDVDQVVHINEEKEHMDTVAAWEDDTRRLSYFTNNKFSPKRLRGPSRADGQSKAGNLLRTKREYRRGR